MTDTVAHSPSLAELQSELRHNFLVLAVLLNDIYGPHSLRAVLGVESDVGDHEAMDKANVNQLRLGMLLPEAYDYAFHGKLTEAIARELNDAPTYFDAVSDFLHMLENNDSAEVVWSDIGREANFVVGGLRQMVDLAQARNNFDSGQSLDAREIALLGGISERSVQNAFSLKGPQGLPGKRVDGKVEVSNPVARRWLSERRSFVPTTKVSFRSPKKPPKELRTGVELRAFLKEAIKSQFKGHASTVATRIGIPVEALEKRLRGEQPIELGEACRLAQALGIDEGWFLLQVMRLNHPHEIEVLTNTMERRS